MRHEEIFLIVFALMLFYNNAIIKITVDLHRK